MVLRQVRGGGLSELPKYEDLCDFSFEAEKTEVRVFKRATEADRPPRATATKKDGQRLRLD